MASWLKGEITREEAEALVNPSKNGTFCVRARAANQWVLCVVYKNKPTHHLIKKNDGGVLSINNKTYGSHSSVDALINHLAGPSIPGWPVPLIMPTSGGDGGGGGVGGGAASGGSRWLHGAISKPKSEELLMADGAMNNGRFLIRKRGPDSPDLVLSLVFRGKPTQHLITTNEDGNLCVNKKDYGGYKTIQALVAAISADPIPSGWPIKLIEGVDGSGAVFAVKGGVSAGGGGGGGGGAASPPAARAGGGGGGGQPWLHPKMSNPDAVARLAGKTTDGTFMIRVHDASQHQYVISVVYRGKPTHHLCVAPPSSASTINKKATGVTGLTATVDKIRSKQPYWPVPLGEHIPGSAGGGGAAAPANNSAADAGAAAAAAKAAAAAAEEAAAAKAAEEAAAAKAAEEAAAAKAAEEAAAAEAAKEEDRKSEGFKSLPNPYPEGPEATPEDNGEENESGYMAVGPTASDLLAQARMIAIAASSGLDDSMKNKYGVGKILGGLTGESATDEMYDVGAGGVAGNPYMVNPGLAGTGAGAQKMASLESAVLEVDHRVNANRARIEGVEELMDVLAEAITLKQEVAELRTKNVTLEKKLLMLEQFLMKGAAEDEGESAMSMTEVRLINVGGNGPTNQASPQRGVRGGRGAAASNVNRAPIKSDLANTSLIGKIAVMKGTSYGEMRDMIGEQFDDGATPDAYKFFTMEADLDDLLMIHEKQEFKVTLDAYVVYIAKTGVATRGRGY